MCSGWLEQYHVIINKRPLVYKPLTVPAKNYIRASNAMVFAALPERFIVLYDTNDS